MRPLFKIGVTYSTVTPESAAIGDYAETGWSMEYRDDYSLRDIVDEIKQRGIEYLQNDGNSLTSYGFSYCSDYQAGEETQERVHVQAKPKNIQRLIKILNKKTKMRCSHENKNDTKESN